MEALRDFIAAFQRFYVFINVFFACLNKGRSIRTISNGRKI